MLGESLGRELAENGILMLLAGVFGSLSYLTRTHGLLLPASIGLLALIRRGPVLTALAVFMAKQGEDKSAIKHTMERTFKYDLGRTVDEIRPAYRFDVSCQGTVPEAIISFLDSNSYEDAIRNAISLGGDSDTLACITGGIAEAYYKEIPTEILREVKVRLDTDLWDIAMRFYHTYGIRRIVEKLDSFGEG